MSLEVCAFCGEEWYDTCDGYSIIGRRTFRTCISCIIDGAWEEHELRLEEDDYV